MCALLQCMRPKLAHSVEIRFSNSCPVFGEQAEMDGHLPPTASGAIDPMYGPAVRSKKILKSWRSAVLHQCIRPYVGASCSGPSWISARLRSH